MPRSSFTLGCSSLCPLRPLRPLRFNSPLCARLGVEAIEPRRAVLADLLHALRRLHNARDQQLLAEVALVQRAVQNGLVDLLQLAQRELRRQQLEANGRVLQLATQP